MGDARFDVGFDNFGRGFWHDRRSATFSGQENLGAKALGAENVTDYQP